MLPPVDEAELKLPVLFLKCRLILHAKGEVVESGAAPANLAEAPKGVTVLAPNSDVVEVEAAPKGDMAAPNADVDEVEVAPKGDTVLAPNAGAVEVEAVPKSDPVLLPKNEAVDVGATPKSDPLLAPGRCIEAVPAPKENPGPSGASTLNHRPGAVVQGISICM